MASNFPSSLDTFTNPSSTDAMDSVSVPHATQHSDLNDAVEALQAKVGADSSAVTTSIDYQLNTGYRYHSTVYFTSSGSFTKASYPWLRAIRVKMVGGGGGGGGSANTGAGEMSVGGGGAGGCYAESFITNIAGLSASETVTVGAAGVGVTGANGTDGGTSSFGSLVSAVGGNNGNLGTAGAPLVAYGAGGTGGGTATGDLRISGMTGLYGFALTLNSRALTGGGGDSHLGAGVRPSMRSGQSSGNNANSDDYGGGGGGAANADENQAAGAQAGGNGGPGIVIVELYA